MRRWPVTRPFGVVTPGLEAFGKHTGVDLGIPAGVPILAAFGGTVVVDDDDAYYDPGDSATWSGIAVKIRRDNGDTCWDAHLARNVVANGQRVRIGEVIGYCGSTGASTGAHLHREVRLANGQLVDPVIYFEEDDMTEEQVKALLARYGLKDQFVVPSALKQLDQLAHHKHEPIRVQNVETVAIGEPDPPIEP